MELVLKLFGCLWELLIKTRFLLNALVVTVCNVFDLPWYITLIACVIIILISLIESTTLFLLLHFLVSTVGVVGLFVIKNALVEKYWFISVLGAFILLFSGMMAIIISDVIDNKRGNDLHQSLIDLQHIDELEAAFLKWTQQGVATEDISLTIGIPLYEKTTSRLYKKTAERIRKLRAVRPKVPSDNFHSEKPIPKTVDSPKATSEDPNDLWSTIPAEQLPHLPNEESVIKNLKQMEIALGI